MILPIDKVLPNLFLKISLVVCELDDTMLVVVDIS